MKTSFSGISLYEDVTTDYSDLLEATRAAFSGPIHGIIARLDLKAGMHILDVGAGTGDDMIDLAAAVAPEGQVTGLELARPHFEKAVSNVAASPYHENITTYHCDIFRFACPAASYDLIWCKYTLACFFDPLRALRRMKTLLKNGGRIVVINDLCPMHWVPGTLLGEDRARESRLYSAIFEYIKQHRKERRAEYGMEESVGKASCAGVMRQAGYRGIETYTQVAEEVGRLSKPLRRSLAFFLERSFPEKVVQLLSAADREYVEEIKNPDSPAFLLNRSDLHIIKPITALIGRK